MNVCPIGTSEEVLGAFGLSGRDLLVADNCLTHQSGRGASAHRVWKMKCYSTID
jgi:hypothetical protein